MSTLDKLRQKRAARRAADDCLEALLEGSVSAAPSLPIAPVASAPAPLATSNGSRREHHSAGPANGSGLRGSDAPPAPAPTATGRSLVGSRAVSSATSVFELPQAPKAPPFSAQGNCPSAPQQLRTCVLQFMCGSDAFGPLPVSGVGLNAALRREFMRAGYKGSALSIFRASETSAAVRSIHKELRSARCDSVLVLEDTAEGENLLIIDADPARIYRALLADSGSAEVGGGSSSSHKRRRRATAAEAAQADGAAGVPAPQPSGWLVAFGGTSGSGPSMRGTGDGESNVDSVEDLLKAPTAKQRQLIDAGDELRQLLAEPTARQSITAQRFMNKSQNMAQFCSHGSRADCRKDMGGSAACAKIHFKKIIKPWTDESLGDCSYLDTCRHIDKCKYVHYALDLTVEQAKYFNECGVHNRGTDTKRINEVVMKGRDLPAQWVQCDLRVFPLRVFNGSVSVVMADPPWDIHMELPYGTLTDDEVRNLKIGDIHEDGVIFLWVTGRAMELARDCFRIWGYRRIEEIIWVKTNQLQRIIRTGRTGHWINHSKEHCLVGIKGNPKLNRNLDCDVIVSEVRETSRKPDEIYNLIERMFPNSQKLELFGRPHNVHENWITCGNQLDGCRLVDEEIVRRYNVEFPKAKIEPWRREHEAVVPVHMPNTGSLPPPSTAGCLGGLGAADSPWIPPMSAPAPHSGPFATAPPRPSTGEAWMPPGGPPAGTPSHGSWPAPPHGMPPPHSGPQGPWAAGWGGYR